MWWTTDTDSAKPIKRTTATSIILRLTAANRIKETKPNSFSIEMWRKSRTYSTVSVKTLCYIYSHYYALCVRGSFPIERDVPIRFLFTERIKPFSNPRLPSPPLLAKCPPIRHVMTFCELLKYSQIPLKGKNYHYEKLPPSEGPDNRKAQFIPVARMGLHVTSEQNRNCSIELCCTAEAVLDTNECFVCLGTKFERYQNQVFWVVRDTCNVLCSRWQSFSGKTASGTQGRAILDSKHAKHVQTDVVFYLRIY